MRFPGLDSRLLVDPPEDDWPVVRIERGSGERELPRAEADERRASFRMADGGGLVLDRPGRRATYFTARPLSDDEIVHPYLARTGAVFAHWLGRQSFHAGAFVLADRAWALVGDREAGKSTALAMLQLAGHSVLTDDLLVIRERTALAGPRCVDLREDAVPLLQPGARLSASRSGTRRRLLLPAVEPEVPLAGFVFLEWGDHVAVRQLPLEERLGRLNRYRGTWTSTEDPEGLLDFAALPSFELRRPRGRRSADTVVDHLVAALAG